MCLPGEAKDVTWRDERELHVTRAAKNSPFMAVTVSDGLQVCLQRALILPRNSVAPIMLWAWHEA